jgi:hypothetical protein
MCGREYARENYKKNKEKYVEKRKKWESKNKEKIASLALKFNLKRNYGISVESFNEMVEKQNGKCLICGNTNGTMRLCVDHCHKTGKIRGLLCGKCNNGLGCFNDDINKMQLAIEYIRKYGEGNTNGK